MANPHHAIFVLQTPAKTEDGDLVISLDSGLFAREMSNLGRFRITVTDATNIQQSFALADPTDPLMKLVSAVRFESGPEEVARLFNQILESGADAESKAEFIKPLSQDAEIMAALIRLRPDDESLFVGEGQQFASSEHWQMLAQEYSQQLDGMVEHRDYWQPRSQLIQKIIRRDDPVFEALMALRPNDPLLTINQGREFALQSDWKNAVKHYAIVESLPISEDWYEYATVLLLANKHEKYRKIMTSYVTQVGESEDPWLAYFLSRAISVSNQEIVEP
jgi:hypothetical protein